MKKRNTLFAALVAAGLLAAAPAMAAETSAPAVAKSVSFGIMDMEGVLKKSTAGADILATVDAKRKEYEGLIAKEEAALKKEKEDIVKQRDKMTEVEFENKRKAFEQKAADAFKKVQERKQTLDYAINTSMVKLREEALKVTAEIARARGLDAVFSDDSVILAETGYDISDEVLKTLNKDVKKIPVSFTLPKKK